jgi:hypothetical protein
VRIISHWRSRRLRHLALGDDAIIVAASLCGLGATIIITTAVDSGLGKKDCLLSSEDIDQIQIKVFASTILFVFALSISKCSMLLFLHRAADTLTQRLGVMIVGIVVLMWTLAVMTGIVFECEMPGPWEIWTGKCIPMVCSYLTTSPYGETDLPSGPFLDNSNGGRYHDRHSFDRAFCPHGLDSAA